MVRAVVSLLCTFAVALCALSASGCAASDEPATVIAYLRDDVVESDIDALSSMLRSDSRVSGFQYTRENVTLTEEAAAAADAPTDGPEGDPLSTAWLEFAVQAESQDAVLSAVESHPAFSRTVLVPLDGDWWHMR